MIDLVGRRPAASPTAEHWLYALARDQHSRKLDRWHYYYYYYYMYIYISA
jgi:hypothetical protein